MKERPPLLSYGVAVLATVAAALLRLAVGPLVTDSRSVVPFITFFPSVLFASWYGGFRAGALSVLLSALAADYFFVSPVGSFRIPDRGDQVSLVIFVAVGLALALMGHSQRQALARAEREVTQRTRAEEAERTERSRLETTLSSVGDAVISTDAEGRIAFVNPVAQSLLRATQANVAGKHLDEVFRIVNEFTRKPVENPVTRVLREGAVVGLGNHTMLIALDGTEIPIDDSAAPIRDEKGTILGTILVFRDITARRRAEASTRLLASVVESSDDGIISRDIRGAITSWNMGAERIFGYSAEEAIGQPLSIIAAPDRIDEIPAILERIRKRERIAHYETVRRTKSGTLVDISLTVSPVHDAEGQIVGVSGIVRDITERKKAEEAVGQSLEELRRANEDLNQFAFAVSHDLQEPLRMITSYSQLLLEGSGSPVDGEAAVCVNFITEGTKRMRDLLSDLLAYTQVNASEQRSVELIDVNHVFQKAIENLETSIRDSQAVVTRDDLPFVAGQEAHFVQLFQNLIGNAIKYRGEKTPRIHVSAARRDGAWRFAVSDNGIGIAPEYHQKIFGVFKRLHGKSIPGTGIGLAICQRVVHRYGGRIWVESQAKDGATFCFTLPAANGERSVDHG